MRVPVHGLVCISFKGFYSQTAKLSIRFMDQSNQCVLNMCTC